ncbi:hypothetical protein B0T11DRAFT_280421 [Plectosphaerella cucumerina]|uniref:Secreted protein n=1 Tax=Plectosphaerella cucumerina TaxID=40658 RepID=A0A8K0X4Y5_9PEZI|nr:hypothetical protein B0T11DRAFT_280421 [Plectosphaerella cucumerina]
MLAGIVLTVRVNSLVCTACWSIGRTLREGKSMCCHGDGEVDGRDGFTVTWMQTAFLIRSPPSRPEQHALSSKCSSERLLTLIRCPRLV